MNWMRPGSSSAPLRSESTDPQGRRLASWALRLCHEGRGDAGSGNLQEDVALHSAHRRRTGKDDAKKESAAAVLNKGLRSRKRNVAETAQLPSKRRPHTHSRSPLGQ